MPKENRIEQLSLQLTCITRLLLIPNQWYIVSNLTRTVCCTQFLRVELQCDEMDRPGGVGSGGGMPMGCVIDGIIVGAPKVCIVFDETITCQPHTHTHTYRYTPKLDQVQKCL